MEMIVRVMIIMFGMGYMFSFIIQTILKAFSKNNYIDGYKEGLETARKIVSGECNCEHSRRCKKNIQ